ncbi:MAG: nucleotidyltransferase family protein [Candidatus Marinimicrobia bacterium]|nr:nucleotidyltransferase family protein [Candidatus Neomarinimicrobiota bacterium]
MKAILPVAAKGSRLLPHTGGRQKSLLPIGGKPVLSHVLDPLVAAGVTDLTLIVGHLGKQVEEYMATYSQAEASIIYQYQQKGLAHAVLLGLEEVDRPVLIVLGDAVYNVDYEPIINGSGNVIAICEVDNPSEYGIVETAGKKVIDMAEKPDRPQSNQAIVGIYKIESQAQLKLAIEEMMADEQRYAAPYQLTDALKMMLDGGAPFRAETVAAWHDCGTPENLLATNQYILEKQGGSYCHPAAAVADSTIRHSSIMEGCEISRSLIDHAIILPGAKLDKCTVRNEIIRAGARLDSYVSGQ